MRFYKFLLLLLIVAVGHPSFAGGWYVGNTASGEWVQYDQVWLTAGSYRFTAHAGSPSSGALLHLEVDGVAVKPGVAVPNTGRVDSFADVSMGSATLLQGYHTLRVVFETSGVSLDWFMLHKDPDTTTTVKAADTVMVRPSTTGMLVSPIVSYNQQSDANSLFNANDSSYINSYPQYDVNNKPYSDYQLRNWYRVPMFEDFDRRSDRYWDIMVELLLAARAQVPLIHCRGTVDFTHDLQDRGYIVGDGAFEGRWLAKLAAAVVRNPQAASSLQIGMFFEDGPLAADYFAANGVYPAWGDAALADYVMQYWLQPWLDSVPTSLLYQPSPGRFIINIWTGHPIGMVQDGAMGTFLANIRTRIQARYGLNPLFLVSPDADASAQSVAWGVLPWYVWGGPLYTSKTFDGLTWGFSSVGSRHRLDNVWLNDWNPVTNTGTPAAAGGDPGVDDYQSPLDASGNSTLLSFYSQAAAAGTRIIQEEGFFNLPEGSPIWPSYASGWKFPNQHLAAMRQYADVTTDSLKFEAEDSDEYYKTTVHTNLGGTYRNEWYTTTTGLDVYQPEHTLNPWAAQSAGPGNLVNVSAGFFDVWALDAKGQIWAHGISDGTANKTWTPASMNGVAKFTQLAVGKHHAWALSGTSVYTCKLPYSWETQAHTTWTLESGSMAQLSVDEAEVWAVDANGLIYKRRVNELDYPGDVWTPVPGPGPAVNSVYVGGNSKIVWAVSGSNLYYTPKASISWIQVTNPFGITQLSVGSQEVWGVNAAGTLYRRSISGAGGWDAVDGTMTQIAVGENYAWGLSGSTPYSRRLTGFLGNATASIPSIPTGVAGTAGNSSATLSWATSAGAAGYNVKRATTSGGPYTTVGNSTSTSAADTGLTNGTTYYYVVSAFNGVGESANSSQVSVTAGASGSSSSGSSSSGGSSSSTGSSSSGSSSGGSSSGTGASGSGSSSGGSSSSSGASGSSSSSGGSSSSSGASGGSSSGTGSSSGSSSSGGSSSNTGSSGSGSSSGGSSSSTNSSGSSSSNGGNSSSTGSSSSGSSSSSSSSNSGGGGAFDGLTLLALAGIVLSSAWRRSPARAAARAAASRRTS